MNWSKKSLEKLFALREEGKTWDEISDHFSGVYSPNACRKAFWRTTRQAPSTDIEDLKILVFDVETAPLQVLCWGLWNQNISLEMVQKDSSILSWSAKWLGQKEVMYMDTRGQKDVRNDKRIVKELYKLLNEADIILTQNGDSFDVKVLNARLVYYDIDPPSSFESIDTLKIARKKFRFISNKLQYMTGNLCTENVKLSHKKFPGMSLWIECLKDNIQAWKEMESYNKADVLSLEELYVKRLRKWGNSKVFDKARKAKAKKEL